MAATYPEDLQILRRLKPDPKTDDLESLLVESARLGHVDTVRYLLELGARPNAKENGGSAAVDNCLESFEYGKFRYRSYFTDLNSRSKASKYAEQIALVRRDLYKCEPEVTVEIDRTTHKEQVMFRRNDSRVAADANDAEIFAALCEKARFDGF
jgi:hypothetical protein